MCVVGTQIFLLGRGLPVRVYDSTTSSWDTEETRSVTPGTSAVEVVTCVAGATIYVFGVENRYKTACVHTYDTVTDTWEMYAATLSDCPLSTATEARVIGDIIYLVCTDKTVNPIRAFHTVTRAVWEVSAPLNIHMGVKTGGRVYSAVVGNKLHVLETRTRHQFVYDPSTDVWAKAQVHLPANLGPHGCAVATYELDAFDDTSRLLPDVPWTRELGYIRTSIGLRLARPTRRP